MWSSRLKVKIAVLGTPEEGLVGGDGERNKLRLTGLLLPLDLGLVVGTEEELEPVIAIVISSVRHITMAFLGVDESAAGVARHNRLDRLVFR